MKKIKDWNNKFLKKTWHFLWHEDSALSWFANLVLAVILVKFVIIPFLGLILGTSFPVVAVVSSSMDHNPIEDKICGTTVSNYNGSLDSYWNTCGKLYENIGIDKKTFESFPLSDGFEKGNIMVLVGAKPDEIKKGDIIVFRGGNNIPIIHRVVIINEKDGKKTFTTKGDHNEGIIPSFGEVDITEDKIIGKAVLKIPYLGYIKIAFDKIIVSIFGR